MNVAADQPAAGKPAAARPKFRLGRVLLIVVPIAILAIAALILFRFSDIDAMLGDLARPRLVPVTGQVLYNGKPLLGGQILTRPAGARGLSAIGWTDDEGRFSLKTDIRGKFVDGVTLGEHVVVVTAHQPIPAAAAPPLLTPAVYASTGTSPLRIVVAPDPAKNQFQLILQGDPPHRGQAPGSTTGKAKSKTKSKAKLPSQPETQSDSDANPESQSLQIKPAEDASPPP